MQALDIDLNDLKSQEKTDPDADVLPRRFERYTLLKTIARGGMGEVFLATAAGIEGAERPCVLKAIRREHIEDRSFLARFLDEARIQAQLQHPGVAQVLEATTDAVGKPYVVVEYVEGHNLGDMRGRAAQLGVRIGWADALAIAIAMADALLHVHERTDSAGKPLDIVHRDLSPQNVMVGYAGDVKLIDFGTARGQNRRCQTIAGIVFAKPGYVAPEVANNTPGGVPADLYAFGIMLWELISGRRFLTGEASVHMAAVAAGKKNPTPLAEAVGAPRELDSVIGRMTALNIEDRYASARQAVNDLVRLMQRAPSMADGDRSVRGRIAQLMQKLYPAEPARSRAEFARLVLQARAHATEIAPALPAPSPPTPVVEVDPSLLPGTRYRLVREIGRGGMGVVYEALQLDLGRTVALKVLERESLSAEAEARFRTEARAIAQISHDNLVKLFEFGVAQDGRPFYAMELLSGESLDQKLARERGMDYREVALIGIQACRALEAAHETGVIHRDIKPANLFLTRSGKVKLLDFGVAKAGSNLEPDRDANGALVVLGTPEYMAPEQARGEEADERSDLYALGAVLYELATGRLPHMAESTVEMLDLKLRTKPEALRTVAPERGIPKMLDRTVSRVLSTDPERRYANAQELREALEAALHEPEERDARRRSWARGLSAFSVTLAIGSAVSLVALKPELRTRVTAVTAPLLAKAHALRVHAIERLHAPAAVQTQVLAAVSPPSEARKDIAEPQAPEPALPPSSDTAAADSPALVPPAQVADRGAALAKAPAAEDAEDDSGETAETNAATEPVSPPGEAQASASSDEAGQLLAEVTALKAKGNKIRALGLLRRFAKKTPGDARILRELAASAEDNGAWGEAVRVARRRVAAEPSVESKLELARLERKTGHREKALGLLRALVEANPDSAESRAMLAQLAGPEAVALQK